MYCISIILLFINICNKSFQSFYKSNPRISISIHMFSKIALEQLLIQFTTGHGRSWGSLVSTVSDYGLDDQGLIPSKGKGFCFQPLRPDQLWGPPNLPSNGYQGVLPPWVKCGWGVTLTTHPHLVQRSRMSRSYTSSPPKRLHEVQQDSFTFTAHGIETSWHISQKFSNMEYSTVLKI
jgi:hypothetical protein